MILQSLKETRILPIVQRVLSLAEEGKILEACSQAVLVDMDMLSGSTSITVTGLAERVHKVSPLLQAVNDHIHASLHVTLGSSIGLLRYSVLLLF